MKSRQLLEINSGVRYFWKKAVTKTLTMSNKKVIQIVVKTYSKFQV